MIEDPSEQQPQPPRRRLNKVISFGLILLLVGGAWLSLRVFGERPMRSVGGDSSGSTTSPDQVGPEGSLSPGGVVVAGSPAPGRTSGVNDFSYTSPTPGINQSKGQMPLEVTIEPRCGYWGTTMVGKVVTSPRAHVNFAVAYPDGQAYGQFGIARADLEGNLTYAWTIPPSAAYGKGHFLVGSSHDKEEKSAVGAWEFFVREPGTC